MERHRSSVFSSQLELSFSPLQLPITNSTEQPQPIETMPGLFSTLLALATTVAAVPTSKQPSCPAVSQNANVGDVLVNRRRINADN